MKILLFGKNGQLGWELQRTLAPLGELLAYDLPEIDLVNAESIIRLIQSNKPDLIVNATAYTAVDRAENESDIAEAVNSRAVSNLAQQALEVGSALVHYSTDYVFDGAKNSPYLETDLPNPINVYGLTKLAGERAINEIGGAFLILRTSWVYSMRKDSFVCKVLSWARQQRELRVVTDQIGSPTWARMLAEVTALIISKANGKVVTWLEERKGVYHLAGSGAASRYEWAQAILQFDPQKEQQTVKEILPAITSDYPSAAERPMYTALDCKKFESAFGLSLPHWSESLRLAMQAE